MTDLEYFTQIIEQTEVTISFEKSQLILKGFDSRGGLTKIVLQESILKLPNIPAGRKFLQGYIEWFQSGGNSLEEATKKARANIGNVIMEAERGVKCFWLFGANLRPSDVSYA